MTESQYGNREIRAALSESRRLFLSCGLFSVFVNLLMLTGPLFMLQVYDRVLSSRSEATLVTLGGHRRVPVSDDGRARPCTGAGSGSCRRTPSDAARLARATGDPPPVHVSGGAVTPSDRVARPGVHPAVRFELGPVRVLRRTLDADISVRAVHVPLDARGAGGALGLSASSDRAAQSEGDCESSGGIGESVCPIRILHRADARRRRDGAGSRHAGCGGCALWRVAGRGARQDHDQLGPRRFLQRHFEDASPVPAVADARARRVARAVGRDHPRGDDRGVDSARSGPCADRSGGGSVAAASAYAGRVSLVGGIAGGDPAGDGAHRASRTARNPGGAGSDGRRAGCEVRGGARRIDSAGAGTGGRNSGCVGVGQVNVRTGARRGLASHGGLGAARRGGARPVRR